MNSFSPYHSTPTDVFLKRFRSWKRQYLHIIIYTSLFWIFVDVFFIMLFSDCTKEIILPCQSSSLSSLLANNNNTGIIEPIIPIRRRKYPNRTLYNSQTPNAITKTSRIINKWWENQSGATNPPSWHGEGGRAVVIPAELQEQSKKRFIENQFNILASDLMALNRSIKDQRSSKCLAHKFPSDLPTTSIVIVFHNEGNSTLLRTLTSIIIRSPIQYIHEIIMVDDASINREYLKDTLEAFTKELPVPVHILRNNDRLGLMKSRLRGAEIAKGDTLTFLDAHIECSPGWLEYLLYEVKKDRTAVVCPIIDVINDNDFGYFTGSDMTWGGFNWRLNFRWYPVPQREEVRRNGDHSLPLLSPTMAGGLFTINREYFYEIGAYDPGMEVWGGENLEMSFRVWQCGGRVLIHPCSHVGHVFRKQTPYTFPGGTGTVIFHNNKRLVEVWLDKYKDFIYAIMPELKRAPAGDVSERLALRDRLKCKDFQWYLENIYPETSLPINFHHVGAIRTEPMSCLTLHNVFGSQKGNRTATLNIETCLDRTESPINAAYQIVIYSKKGEIRFDDLCFEGSANSVVKLQKCTEGNQKQIWNYNNETKLMKHVNSNQCLTVDEKKDNGKVNVAPCVEGNHAQQRWYLERSVIT
ncbi:unnamed protein product [Adineta steineri]|uniref:Polypeptide N-acetylgalactosaminyltransferase n=2 Tax=Adineta steineri TaxID=433720 RepID=A0A818N2P2_9BILA|nr:unnamed protein product [Adineta steineri]CAF3598699.1 unnamed protein product [Adineta steineri]CAF3776689.1 unnamed protein product [Adineta steineri]